MLPSTFLGWLLVGGIVLVILLIWNRRAVADVLGWGRANASQLARDLKNTTPMAVLNQEIDDAVDRINKGKQGLAQYGAILKESNARVKSLKQEADRLSNRIDAVLAEGDPEGTATGYAEDLVTVEAQLADAQAQQGQFATQYEMYVTNVQAGQEAIARAQAEARQLDAQLKLSQAAQTAAEYAAGFDPNAINSPLNEARQAVQRKIYTAEATADVANLQTKKQAAQGRDDARERRSAAEKLLAARQAKRTPPANQQGQQSQTVGVSS